VDRPPLWAKITDGINAVVWRAPLPHRAKRLLSGNIYRNPAMSAERAAETLATLDRAGVTVCCMGGWGVDALIGEQSRKHRDLDLIIAKDGQAVAMEALAGLGYHFWYEQSADGFLGNRIVVRDRAMRVVDVHPIDFDEADLSIVAGSIGGHPVKCLSAGQQVRDHAKFRNRSLRERRNQRSNAEVARRALETEAPSS